MKKDKRIRKILDELIPCPEIPLQHKDTYTLLIAVLLSAQATDKKVNEITPLLFAKASTPQEMMKLPQKEIQEIIRPVGLSPTKNRAILGLSQILLDKYGGKVPRSLEALKELPGVGHKTASVIMAQAFQEPSFPVDTHIHRSAKRWGLSSGKNVKETERDLKALFPKSSWNKLHLQIVLFARRYCPAKKHDSEKCPICSWAAPKDLSKKLVTSKKSAKRVAHKAAHLKASLGKKI